MGNTVSLRWSCIITATGHGVFKIQPLKEQHCNILALYDGLIIATCPNNLSLCVFFSNTLLLNLLHLCASLQPTHPAVGRRILAENYSLAATWKRGMSAWHKQEEKNETRKSNSKQLAYFTKPMPATKRVDFKNLQLRWVRRKKKKYDYDYLHLWFSCVGFEDAPLCDSVCKVTQSNSQSFNSNNLGSFRGKNGGLFFKVLFSPGYSLKCPFSGRGSRGDV